MMAVYFGAKISSKRECDRVMKETAICRRIGPAIFEDINEDDETKIGIFRSLGGNNVC